MVDDFRRYLADDPDIQVRVYFAQTTQVIISPFRDPQVPQLRQDLSREQQQLADQLAAVYVPILLDVLNSTLDSSDEVKDDNEWLRNEVLVALQNFSTTPYMYDTANLKKLEMWHSKEKDEIFAAQFDNHPLIGKWLARSPAPKEG